MQYLGEYSLKLNTTNTPCNSGGVGKCRICHEESLPLVKVCQCLGSLAYVHEGCIKQWICCLVGERKGKRELECELCGAALFLTITPKIDRISYQLLLSQLKILSRKDKLISLLFLTLFIVTLLLDIQIVAEIIRFLVDGQWEGNIYATGVETLVIIGVKVILPLQFAVPCMKILRKLKKIGRRSPISHA